MICTFTDGTDRSSTKLVFNKPRSECYEVLRQSSFALSKEHETEISQSFGGDRQKLRKS